MAGSPPPPDAPEPGLVSADIGFAPGPPAASLCGFALPSFRFGFSLNLPGLPWPPPLPFFSFSLSLNCDLNNPLSVSGGLSFGGGRVASFDPDPDEVALAQYETQ